MEIIWSPRAESDFERDITYLEDNTSRKNVTAY